MKPSVPSMRRRVLLLVLSLAMLINLVLAIDIQVQKEARLSGNTALLGKCFATGGGCETVQLSSYSQTLGISNPYFGFVFFTLWAVMFAIMAFTKRYDANSRNPLLASLILGALFSAWLLCVQFFIIHSICIYCLWVDIIMITTTIIFLVTTRMKNFIALW